MISRLGVTAKILESANGSWVYLGTITATTTPQNNYTTGTPFANSGDGLAGKTLLFQSDLACIALPGTDSTATVTTTNGLLKNSQTEYVTIQHTTMKALAFAAVSGTVNVKVWELI